MMPSMLMLVSSRLTALTRRHMGVINREFIKCPQCKSKRRFFESLAELAKKNNLARKEWRLVYQHSQGVAIDQNRTVILPVGTRVPTFIVETDICLDCGCVYAVRLQTGEGRIEVRNVDKKTLIPGSPS
jgi:hypothetical protein